MTVQSECDRPVVLVMASTYPRRHGDPEPGFVHELCRRLVGRFQVIALVPDAPGADPSGFLDGVEVVRFHYAPRRLQTLVNDGGIVANLKRKPWKWLLLSTFILTQAWCAWRLVRKRRIDVIHAHWLVPQGLIAALLGKLMHRAPPYLVTSHGADLFALRGHFFDVIKRFVVRNAACVTVVSQAMGNELCRIGADVDKVRVLSMGVDLSNRFTPDPAVIRSFDEILFVGRLVEKKGLRHLIDALPMIIQGHPSARLTIAGFGPEDVERRAQVRRLGLDDVVHFIGAVSQIELPALYRRVAVFAAPFVQARSGDQEGLGLVFLEALGCGCPVVMSGLPATRDVLAQTAGCVCVPPGSSHALAQAIVGVLANPQGSRQGADACREKVRKLFDWNTVSHSYGDILEMCINETA